MRIQWDPKKSKLLKENPKRRTSFEEAKVLVESLDFQLGGELKNFDPEQFYVVGFVGAKLITLVYEFRYDDLGEYIHLVTLWKTTKQERERFGI